jgi:hypothetical protein
MKLGKSETTRERDGWWQNNFFDAKKLCNHHRKRQKQCARTCAHALKQKKT